MKRALTAERVRELFDYDAELGWLICKVATYGHPVGSRGGSRNKNYRCVRIDGDDYPEHRVIWLLVTGSWPAQGFIDHWNHDGTDNTWTNLRPATIQQNNWNKSIGSNNSSGYKGVSWHKTKNKWIASIKVHGKQYHLGYYHNAEDAYAAYCEAGAELFGKFFCAE
jgi:hypothetical protein